MDDSYEVDVDEDPFVTEWWGEESEEWGWRMHITPSRHDVGLVHDQHGLRVNEDGPRDPEHKIGDRVLWWRHDDATGEVCVRVPQGDPLELDRGLWLEKRYRLTEDGRVVATGHIELRNLDRQDPLTSELQSAIGLRDINRQIERQLRVVARRMNLGQDWERATVDVRRPGRQGMPDLELAQWAERYVEALEVEPRRPYAVLNERYPGWSDSGLKSIVRRARKAGFLSEVGQGKTGGELTDDARRLLAGQAWADTAGKQDKTSTEDDQ